MSQPFPRTDVFFLEQIIDISTERERYWGKRGWQWWFINPQKRSAVNTSKAPCYNLRKLSPHSGTTKHFSGCYEWRQPKK